MYGTTSASARARMMVKCGEMVLSFLALIGFSFIGPVVSPFVPFLATEVMAAVYAVEMGLHPLVVGLACTIGQNLAYTVLYLAGGKFVLRWDRLHQQIEWLRAKYATARRTFLLATIGAALIGIPPMIAMVVVARGFGMRLMTLLAIGIPLRAVRFALLAALGGAIWPAIVDLWHRIFA